MTNFPKIKVSKKDKNLVGLLVLVETAIRSVVTHADQKRENFHYVKMPAEKAELYDYIKNLLQPVLDEISEFNTKINEEYLKIYARKEMDLMMDSVLACLDMIEKQDAKQVNNVMRQFGWKGAEAFFREREKKGA